MQRQLSFIKILKATRAERCLALKMASDLLQKLGNKTLTKEALFQMVKQDFSLVPEVLSGTSSPKATVRYGCGKVLMDLSERQPEAVYPYMDRVIELLDSKYRILTWNALAIIANLATVDEERKFDKIFDKYYGFLNDEYMVTVANTVGNSAKIALAKPYLAQRITAELLKVENLKLTPHLTEECKRVIAEHAIKTFNAFFEEIEDKEQVLSFAEKHLESPRASLRREAQSFVKKWG
jgi:hypothetical protein